MNEKESDEIIRRAITLIPIMFGIFAAIFAFWIVIEIATSAWHRDELHVLQRQVKALEQKCKITP